MKKSKKQSKPSSLVGVLAVTIILGSLNAFTMMGTGEMTKYPSQAETPKIEAIQPSTISTTTSIVVKKVTLISDKPEVELKIRAIADELNFQWPDYLVKLAKCESELDPKAFNNKGNYPKDSYDRGVFQFNSYWQAKVSDECAYDLDCATRKTIEMINNGSQHLWACDKIILAKK